MIRLAALGASFFSVNRVAYIFPKDEAVTSHFTPIRQVLETGDDAGPLHQGRIRVILIKLPPNHDRRLLEHLIGVGPSREQRSDNAPQVGLMLGKARHECLVADIIRGSRGILLIG